MKEIVKVIDLKPFVKNKDIKELIGLCVYKPKDMKIERLIDEYVSNDYRYLLGLG